MLRHYVIGKKKRPGLGAKALIAPYDTPGDDTRGHAVKPNIGTRRPRVYTIGRGTVVYLLLCGGDKSTQRRDIRRALALARALPEENQP